MPTPGRLTTTVSTKGQVILPKALRERRDWPPGTAMLETEWVLRSACGFGAGEAVRALRAFGGLPTVTLEDTEHIAAGLISRRSAWTSRTLCMS